MSLVTRSRELPPLELAPEGVPRPSIDRYLFAAVLLIRLASVFAQGDLVETTGTEGVPIYGVWKARNGLPVYDWPAPGRSTPSIYNFMFYEFYGVINRVVGADGPRGILAGRLASLGFCAIVMIATWRVMGLLAGPGLNRRAVAFNWLLAIIACFSSATTRWWCLSVRPDFGALALATLGLLAYSGGGGRPGVVRCLAASALFYLSWSFKQTNVCILTGLCLYELTRHFRGGRWLALALPCGAFMAATLAWGGPAYRYNILHAPMTGRWDLDRCVYILAASFASNPLLLLTPLYLTRGTFLAIRGEGRDDPRRPGDLRRAIAFASTVALVWGGLAAGRNGADRNYLYEYIVCNSILASAVLLEAFGLPGRASPKARALAIAAVLAIAAFPTAQIAFFDRVGRLTLAPRDEYSARAAMAREFGRMPGPRFSWDSMLALPWHSTGGGYPALVLDTYLFTSGDGGGIFWDRSIRERILRRSFVAVILDDRGGKTLYRDALEAGYVPSSSFVDYRGVTTSLLVAGAGRPG